MNEGIRVKSSGRPATDIAEALGIDPRTCVAVTFTMRVGKLVKVTVERNVRDHEAKAFAKVLERFNLVPEENGPQEITSIADTAVRKAIRGAP